MQIGIDSFATFNLDPAAGPLLTGVQRMHNLIEEIVVADQSGVDVFGIGEHHRAEHLDSAPTLILAGAATRTQRIKLTSAVTVLSADDPVRVFQQFATLDLLSAGRAELVAGRGSSIEAYPLFGLDLHDYDSLFIEKLQLLLKLNAEPSVTWSGKHRPPLTGQGVYPRPAQGQLPIWVGVGGTPESFARAGTLGLPLMVAIIGGSFGQFKPLVDLYRQAGERAGHAPEQLKVGIHAFGFVAETDAEAADVFYPGWEARFTKIGRERGWPPPSRAQFEASRSPGGAYLIGNPETVAKKILQLNKTLGPLARVNLQMTNDGVPQANMLKAIELLGQQVKPQVNEALGA